MASEKKFCPACGSEMDSEGICTNAACARRKIQVRKKAADKAAEEAKS